MAERCLASPALHSALCAISSGLLGPAMRRDMWYVTVLHEVLRKIIQVGRQITLLI